MFAYHQPTKWPLRDEDNSLIRQAFAHADSRKRGYLNRDDLKIAFVVALGYKPSKYELDEILNNFGKKDAGSHNTIEELVLDKAMFEKVMQGKLQYADTDEEIRETFQLLDANFKGFIDIHSFEKIVKKFLPKMDSLKIQRIFNAADGDGDGRVSFRDFQMVMQHQKYI